MWVDYYKLRGHHFRNVPEIQERSWFVLQGIAKKSSSIDASSSGKNAGCIAYPQKGTSLTDK